MSRKVSRPESAPLSASEVFQNSEIMLDSRNPLSLAKNKIESPDDRQKKLMSEIRSLSSRIIELQNYCDDIENEKRELLQNKNEHEDMIALLEEKCRTKDRELNEIRDSCSELEILRSDYEKIKVELDRVTTLLKNAQETDRIVESLENENNELLKENTEFRNRIKLLEAYIEELKDEEGYKPLYEQVREALTSAEKALSELLLENERARELSEVEALDSNCQSDLAPWTKISCDRCTCTCHHNSITFSRNNDGSMRRFSTISVSDANTVINTTPVRSNDRQFTQGTGDLSVIDVSLWRDVRTGPSPNDVSGECLAEAMAQDARILDLQVQLNEACSEVSRLNEEVSKLTNQNLNLIAEKKVEAKGLELRLSNLASEKQILEAELDTKCIALTESTNRIESLIAEKNSISEALELSKGESQLFRDELDRLKLHLYEGTSEKAILSEKLTCFECKVAHLTERDEASTAANFEIEKKLDYTQEQFQALQVRSNEIISALELKVNTLSKDLSDGQNRLKLLEALRIEMSDRLEFQLKKDSEHEVQENKLIQQLNNSKRTINDLSIRNQKLSIELDEKVSLVDHLKSELADLLNEKATAMERGDALKSELLQAHQELSRLTNELNEAMACALRVDELESSLRTRESEISTLNQLIQDYKSTISLLKDEKNSLESCNKALRSDLESKSSSLSTTAKERDKAKLELAERLHEFSEAEACFLGRLKSFDSDLANHAKINMELTEKFTSIGQELADCVKQLSLKEGEVIQLKEEVTNHFSEKIVLQSALDEKKSLVSSLQVEITSLTENVIELKAELAKCQREITTLNDEKNALGEKLKIQSVELMDSEAEMIRLRDQLALATADQSRLVNSISELERDRTKLESELSSTRNQHLDIRVEHLKKQLSLTHAEHLNTEQSLAEAKKYASLAEMHQKVAEKETARLNKLVNVLQRRLDAITEERMTCEVRAASKAVRCLQLEGMLSQKETVIEGLRHQLNQLDIQRKLAQEKEASTLREYLKSRAAQHEAERLLALLKSRSTDKRYSYYSLDQPVVSDFLQPVTARWHSDGKVYQPSMHHVKRDVGTDNYVEKSLVPVEDLVFKTPIPADFRRTKVGAPLSQETHDLTFVSCLEEPASTPTPVNRSPILHFLEEVNAPQETDICGLTAVVSSAKLTEIPVPIADAHEMPHYISAASNTVATDTNKVSGLNNWPPYSNCVAPLSPQALGADGFFTVPSPFEFHYRYMRRLMMTPAAEEDYLDANTGLLENKVILTATDNQLHSLRSGTSIHQPIESTNSIFQPLENKLVYSKASLRSTTPQMQNPVKGSSLVVNEPIKTEINPCLNRVEARTAQSTPRSTSMVDHSNDNSPSISRPPAVRVARFHSVQEFCSTDAQSPTHQQSGISTGALDKKANRGGPPVSFNRFKHRFAIHHHKNKANRSTISSLSGRKSNVECVLDKENASTQSSSKSKKYAKLRFSKVFKAKKHEW